eukprot:SAG11_NODE_17004_length_531_cov_1.032407_1_plen_139_part_01
MGQMVPSNNDTADLFGSPLHEDTSLTETDQDNSNDSKSNEGAMEATGDEEHDLSDSDAGEAGADGTEGAAARTETIDGSTPATLAGSIAVTTDEGSEVNRGTLRVPIEAVHDRGHREGDGNMVQGCKVGSAGSNGPTDV